MDVDRCVAGLTSELPAQVAATIERIEGRERQLLALRSYLRSAESLTSRWSWSEEQIVEYAQSAEYRAHRPSWRASMPASKPRIRDTRST